MYQTGCKVSLFSTILSFMDTQLQEKVLLGCLVSSFLFLWGGQSLHERVMQVGIQIFRFLIYSVLKSFFLLLSPRSGLRTNWILCSWLQPSFSVGHSKEIWCRWVKSKILLFFKVCSWWDKHKYIFSSLRFEDTSVVEFLLVSHTALDSQEACCTVASPVPPATPWSFNIFKEAKIPGRICSASCSEAWRRPGPSA